MKRTCQNVAAIRDLSQWFHRRRSHFDSTAHFIASVSTSKPSSLHSLRHPMEHSLPTMANPNAPFPSPTPSSSANNPSGDAASANLSADQTGPHGALFLVLSYLQLRELLAFQRVCRLFRDAIAGDSFLWQHVVVEPPLSFQLTDDALLKVTAKAEGKLKSLVLLDCWKITDAGLLQVADRNPGITKV